MKRSASSNRGAETNRFFVVEAGFSATAAPVRASKIGLRFRRYDRQIEFERIVAMARNATTEDGRFGA